jgi:hypothetical protein
VFSTYERPSAEPLNGRCPDTLTCDFDEITRLWREGAKGVNAAPSAPRNTLPAGPDHYTHEELVLRTGVPPAALNDLRGSVPPRPYAAIDVVRLAVIDRLMRSGVPVARAAALVKAAESRAAAGV